MKNPSLVTSAEKAVAIKMRAMDVVMERLIEPLEKLGNPEELIGKKYEQWTPEDLQKLAMIYGTKEPNALSNLIFRKKYEEVRQLELEEVS